MSKTISIGYGEIERKHLSVTIGMTECEGGVTMTKENASGWEGFVLEKDGENHCIVLKVEGDDGVKEGHFRADFQGKYRINGGVYRPANTDAPDPWRRYGSDLETYVRAYEKEGWVRSPLESFECLCT